MEVDAEAARFAREPLHEVARNLAATARGDSPATLIVRDGTLVSVTSGEILPRMSVAIRGSRIAYIGPDANHAIGPETRVIEAEGRYIAPGFLDGHCHIESSQLTVTQFVRAVLPLGTTGGFFDAHEITNVLGLRGLRLMVDEARTTPLAAYMQIASCVPSTSTNLETPGAEIGPEEVAEALSWGDDVIALGEVMNFPGVVFGDGKMHGEISAALRAGKVADGHFCWPPNDRRLAAYYAASGITGCHEGTTAEDTVWRLRHGMYAKLRRGSAWHDVAATVKAHTEMGLDPRRILLVTDDRSPESLVDEGHMDFVVRHAIEEGVSPIVAFQMATLNAAERFGVSQDVGSVTPGRCGDIILLEGDLADVNVTLTIAAGEVVAEDGHMAADLPGFTYPDFSFDSVKLDGSMDESAFDVPAPVASGRVRARAVRVVENHAETKAEVVELQVEDGLVKLDSAGDVCKISVTERHGKSGETTAGFLMGLGFTEPCALATTVAHDSHNLMVMGNSEALMARAAREVIGARGGVAVVREGGVTLLPLPVAGLMSTEPYEEVAEKSRAVGHALAEAGYGLNYAFMTLSLLALVVLPELHVSDKGLVEVGETGFGLTGVLLED